MKESSNETTEKYLDAILTLSKSKPVVRSVDVGRELGRSKSCVSIAMKSLRENNYITITEEGYIYFTDSGRKIAERINERREVLNSWLIGLGVDQNTAAKDANQIKHYISDKSLQAIRKHSKRYSP